MMKRYKVKGVSIDEQIDNLKDTLGENAYEDFARRASAHHIRLAADMVPNHLGIYSRWIVDHPDRFLSLANPPFPGYSFNGVNLSGDPAIGVYLEDHYYSRKMRPLFLKGWIFPLDLKPIFTTAMMALQCPGTILLN